MLVFVTRIGAPCRSDDTTAGIVSGAGRDDARPAPGSDVEVENGEVPGGRVAGWADGHQPIAGSRRHRTRMCNARRTGKRHPAIER
ncbi:hypothetical protein GPU89_23490 [Burkholderia cepacia]|nr:hypothetical protein [Burkholderia cepacia]